MTHAYACLFVCNSHAPGKFISYPRLRCIIVILPTTVHAKHWLTAWTALWFPCNCSWLGCTSRKVAILALHTMSCDSQKDINIADRELWLWVRWACFFCLYITYIPSVYTVYGV